MTDTSRYNFREAEAKWQRRWQESGVFKTARHEGKPKYYVLEMFPYPSGNIHMGHVRNYALGDVIARVKQAQGYDVLHPMGWDAFGLPAENAAIERGAHPLDWTLSNIATMREQLKIIGLSYDWSRELATCLPDYYKHEQLFFLKFLERGLAYRKEAMVNWDPVDNTVLANEQVIDGKGWRSGAPVERRTLSQWFLRISDYADDLLSGLDGLTAWPEKVRTMQDRWIGKSTGALLKLRVASAKCQVPNNFEILNIYTTRPDTLFGMSFCAISPNHPLAASLATRYSLLATFIQECNQLGTSEEAIEKAEKKGFDTGLKIIHPFDGREVPLYIANFVLMEYGTGAIFACPAHDQRDFEFARKYNLPILPVVQETAPFDGEEAYIGDGTLINSDFLNGLSVDDAKKKVIAELENRGLGTAKINYRLRDWGISRQRYWGCPIPVIHCKDCGVQTVPEKDLPVELPRDVTFDAPGNPLARHPTWKHVACPTCGKPAERETDTFDTFFESSWYFARFATLPSPDPLDPKTAQHWLPVDCYIGGIEHAVLHLLYARFFCRALADCGFAVPHEPFTRLEAQGMVSHETYKDKDGKWLSPDDVVKDESGEWVTLLSKQPVTVGRIEKMSKSKKNTVSPMAITETYGADAARLFMLSDSPPERDLEWTTAGIDGAWRYINRLWKLVMGSVKNDTDATLRKLTHKTIAAVTGDIEKFHFNKAIARIREFTNHMETHGASQEAMEVAVQLINPFMPHLAEELWERLGHKTMLCETPWPKADAELAADDEVTVAVQVNGKLKATLMLPKDADQAQAEQKVLELAEIKAMLSGKSIAKKIYVPGRIFNVVVK
jgi:leucyl-tRNA synthetase